MGICTRPAGQGPPRALSSALPGGRRGVGLVLFQLRVRSEQAADGLGIGYVLRTDPAL